MRKSSLRLRSRSVGSKPRFHSKSSSKKVTFRRKSTVRSRSVKGKGFRKAVYNSVVRSVMPVNVYNSSGTGQFIATTGQQILDGSITCAGPGTIDELVQTFGTTSAIRSISSVSVRSYFQETHFTNASTVPVVMKLYDCFCRRDVPFNTTSTSITVILGNSVTKTGFIPSGFTSTSINTIGYTPYQNHEFVRYFKINRTRSLILQPGGVTRYRLRRKKPFRYDMITGSSDLILAKKGITRCLLLQAYGTPTNDSKTTTVVSTDPIKINRVTTNRYSFVWINDTTMTTTASGSQINRTMTQGASITDIVSSTTSGTVGTSAVTETTVATSTPFFTT